MLSDTAVITLGVISLSGVICLSITLSFLLDYLEEKHRQMQELEMARLGLIWNDDLERWVYGQGEEQPNKSNEEGEAPGEARRQARN